MSKVTDLEHYRQRGADARRLAELTVNEAARHRHLTRADRYDRLVAGRTLCPVAPAPLSLQALVGIEARMPLITQFYQEIGSWTTSTSK